MRIARCGLYRCAAAILPTISSTGTPIAQGLSAPTGLAFGPDGTLYVAEYGGKLYKIAPAG